MAVVVEIVLFTGIVLLFLITDSRTLHVVGGDILKEYNISYKKISGNLFTGIEVLDLRYNKKKIVDSATIYWNPFSLYHNQIDITKLDIRGVNSRSLIDMVEALPPSESSDPIFIPFDINFDEINLESDDFIYHTVDIKNFELEIHKLKLSKEMDIKSKSIEISLDSNLVNIGLKGKIDNQVLQLDRVDVREIDIDVIVSLVNSLNSNSSSKKKQKKTIKNETPPVAPPLLKDIKIRDTFVSLKKITYGPITLEKTELRVSDMSIDPLNSFNINAKKAILLGKTSFADTRQIGYIKNSKLYTKGAVITRKHLFDLYSLPLNQKELHRLPAKVSVNHKGVWVEIDHSVKDLLVLNAPFNVTLKKAKHKLDYIYMDKKIFIRSEATSSMTYSDESDVQNLVTVDIKKRGYTTYEGEVSVKKIKNLPPNISNHLLENLKATYKGDTKKLLVKAESKQIKGEFLTKGYKDADLKIRSKKSILLSSILTLPKDIGDSKGDIHSESHFDFKDIKKSMIGVDIESNLVNLHADMGIKQPFKIDFLASVPITSTLLKLDRKIKIKNLNKIIGKIVLDKDNMIRINFSNRDIRFAGNYNTKSTLLSRSILRIGDEQITIDGDINSVLHINSYIDNIDNLTDVIERYYDLTLPKLKGSADVKMKFYANSNYSKMMSINIKGKSIDYLGIKGNIDTKVDISREKKIDISFKSKKLVYKGDTKLYSIRGKLLLHDDKIEIDSYSFKFYNDYISRFFSTKKSYLRYNNGILSIDKVWINDQVEISGDYNIDNLKGNLIVESDSFGFKTSDFDLIARFFLKVDLDKERVSIKGKINPLGNSISYETIGSGISEDSDILIVQELKKKKDSILNNIKIQVAVEHDTPLKYSANDVNIDFVNNILLIKDYNRDFKLLGITTINKGYYQKDEKQFFLDESHIYFSGDPKKPLLEIKATYNIEQYNIQIFISGTTDDPIINFNSDPYLTQKEILSLILFDSTGSNNRSGTELYALLGGTFAKELMKSLGFSVDHLLLGQGIDERLSVEVGQKISDDITVIYQHNNGKDGIKVRVDHSDNFETDIIVQPPNSSSIEFLFKSD